MAFTRGYDDTDRINMFQGQDYDICNYMLNTPGNGTRPSYIVDPQIRLQKFGANISSGIVDVNSDLKGINRHLTKDNVNNNINKTGSLKNNYSRNYYPNIDTSITDQPRAIYPAWTLRDLEQNNWKYLHSDPQMNTEVQFDNNISTRILEQDNYINKNCP